MIFKLAFVPALLLLAASGGRAGVVIDLNPFLSLIDAQVDPRPSPTAHLPQLCRLRPNCIDGVAHRASASRRQSTYRSQNVQQNRSADPANDLTFFGVYPEFPNFEPWQVGQAYGLGSDGLTGLYWGQHGIVGTADEVLYEIGNPGTSGSLINQLLFIGFGDLGSEGLGPGALPGDDLLALADWESVFGSGYNFSHTYSLSGISNSVK